MHLTQIDITSVGGVSRTETMTTTTPMNNTWWQCQFCFAFNDDDEYFCHHCGKEYWLSLEDED